MKCYYDTGILLKLYTEEPESAEARKFVTRGRVSLVVCDLHLSEITSALLLKQFRKECTGTQARAVLSHVAEDQRTGVLAVAAVDWTEAWARCRALAEAHAARMGCRTLDTLHVACAVLLQASRFVTSDQRQGQLARKAGLKVVNPVAKP